MRPLYPVQEDSCCLPGNQKPYRESVSCPKLSRNRCEMHHIKASFVCRSQTIAAGAAGYFDTANFWTRPNLLHSATIRLPNRSNDIPCGELQMPSVHWVG